MNASIFIEKKSFLALLLRTERSKSVNKAGKPGGWLPPLQNAANKCWPAASHSSTRSLKAMSEYSVNWQFFIRKILILSAKYCQIRYLRVRISGNRHFTCSNQKELKILFFWRPFCHFFVYAVTHNFQSYQPILLILNSKQWVDFY